MPSLLPVPHKLAGLIITEVVPGPKCKGSKVEAEGLGTLFDEITGSPEKGRKTAMGSLLKIGGEIGGEGESRARAIICTESLS